MIGVLRLERSSASIRIARSLNGRYVVGRESTIEEAIRQEEGAVAADLLQAVSDSEMSIAVKLVPELLFSEDFDLQREVVRILETVNVGHFSAAVLVDMLKTPGESVRLRLIQMLIETGDPWAFEPLMDRVTNPTAINRMSDQEAETIGRAMAQIDPARALAVMSDWVRPKKLVDRIKGVTRGHLIQWAGVSGLGMIPDEEAAEAIRWLSSRAGEKLHQHCLRALVGRRHLQRPTQSSSDEVES